MKLGKKIETWVKHRVPTVLRDQLRKSKYVLIMRRQKPIELIVHVGAHYAEDIAFYEEIGAKTILWIEADPDTFVILQDTLKSKASSSVKHLAECALVSSASGNALSFHRFNGDGASSSVYHSTKTHQQRFSHVRETGEVLTLQTQTLSSILSRHKLDIDKVKNSMLVIDVQGHELSVLNGAASEVGKFKFCKCEVSTVEMYKDGAKFEEIDNFLKSKNFSLVSHRYSQVPKHGDVLYQKSDTI